MAFCRCMSEGHLLDGSCVVEPLPASRHGKRESEQFVRAQAHLGYFLEIFLVRLSSPEGRYLTREGTCGHSVRSGLIWNWKLLILGRLVFLIGELEHWVIKPRVESILVLWITIQNMVAASHIHRKFRRLQILISKFTPFDKGSWANNQAYTGKDNDSSSCNHRN